MYPCKYGHYIYDDMIQESLPASTTHKLGHLADSMLVRKDLPKDESAFSWLAVPQYLIMDIVDTSNIKKEIITENLAKATKFLASSPPEAADQRFKIRLLSAELLEEALASETTCAERVCMMCAGQVAVEKKAVDGDCPHEPHSKAQYNASLEMAKVCRAHASATTQHKNHNARATGKRCRSRSPPASLVGRYCDFRTSPRITGEANISPTEDKLKQAQGPEGPGRGGYRGFRRQEGGCNWDSWRGDNRCREHRPPRESSPPRHKGCYGRVGRDRSRSRSEASSRLPEHHARFAWIKPTDLEGIVLSTAEVQPPTSIADNSDMLEPEEQVTPADTPHVQTRSKSKALAARQADPAEGTTTIVTAPEGLAVTTTIVTVPEGQGVKITSPRYPDRDIHTVWAFGTGGAEQMDRVIDMYDVWSSHCENPVAAYICSECHMSTKADLSDKDITEKQIYDKYRDYEVLMERHLCTKVYKWPVH
jgi:hypothetical protein